LFSDKIALEYLSSCGFDLDRALDSFYSKSSSSSSKASKAGDVNKLSRLFDHYSGSDDEKDLMADERLGKFFQDLEVNPESSLTLGIAWQLKCKNFGEIERKEFVTGFSALGVDSLEAIKKETKRIEGIMQERRGFRDFYRWLFDFIKDSEERKTIDCESAYEMWALVLRPHFSHLTDFIEFCKKQQLKTIPKDLWEQLYEFAKEVKQDFSNYEEDGAWPVTIDSFVEQVRAKKQ
jgi:DCN1-like protein 1/2